MRPKKNLHIGQVSQIGETEHRLPPRKGVRNTVMVPVFYQMMADGSRFWLTPGRGEAARRRRHIAAGSLRTENGLVA